MESNAPLTSGLNARDWIAANQLYGPSLIFNPQYYLNKYVDLQNAFGNNNILTRQHYIRFGINEGRMVHPTFNPRYYLNRYPDLKSAFGTNYRATLYHWLNHGMDEGRVGAP